MTRTTRFVEIGDHTAPLKRYFLVIHDDPSDPATGEVNARLVRFLGEVLTQPSLLACGPVSAPAYTIKHDGEKWTLRAEGESAR